MAASVKLYGSEYTYTVSNITNTITCTPSNINSRYGTVYAKPTVTQNKKGAHTRYIFIGPDVDVTDYFGLPTGCFVIYKAVFSASSTTATVTEVNRSGVVLPLGRIAQGLAYRGKANWSDTYGVGLQVSISTSSSWDDEFDWKYARLTLSASGWNPSAPSISPALSPDGLDVSVFGYVQGFCSAQWTASGGRNWSGTSNGFSYNVNPTNTLSVSANGASTSNSGTGSRTAILAYKTLSTTSVTGTAKITNNIGGSATSTATVNVQSYSKPIAKSLAIGRVKQNNEDRATMSIGWAVDILNKQSNVTQSITDGNISCTWECEDLSNSGAVFSSGIFNIVNDGEAMTKTTDTTPPVVLVDEDTSRNHNDYDPDKSFKFTAYITDRIGQSSLAVTAVLSSEFYLICAREGGRGIGFGMVPPDDAMHVNMPATFYDNVEVEGNVEAAGKITSLLQDYTTMNPSSDFSVTSTSATRVTPLTIDGCLGRCFEKQTNQVKVLKSGVYLINAMFMANSVGNTTNIKQVSLYVNGSNLMSARMAIGAMQNVTQIDINTFSAGDILTMYTKFEESSGTRKLSRYTHINIIPLILT